MIGVHKLFKFVVLKTGVEFYNIIAFKLIVKL